MAHLVPHHGLTVPQESILRRVNQTLSQSPEFVQVCVEIVGDHRLSLRTLDWLVTNFAKRTALRIQGPDGGSVYVHDAYRAGLAAFRRRHFDPFCRAQRRTHDGRRVSEYATLHSSGGKALQTCISQLNFMEWAHRHGVLAYAMEHEDAIVADMNRVAASQRKRRRDDAGYRRTELSKAPRAMCHAYSVDVRVTVL
jgi:hypothetical protein